MKICNQCEMGMDTFKPCRLHDPALCESCHDKKAMANKRMCRDCIMRYAKKSGDSDSV